MNEWDELRADIRRLEAENQRLRDALRAIYLSVLMAGSPERIRTHWLMEEIRAALSGGSA